MHFTLPTSRRRSAVSGFTLIEVLIIAPIVVLVIGGFVALIMAMVGDVLLTRDQNIMAYETQDALDRIEQDTRIGTQFLDTSRTLAAPQGSDDGTAAFSSSNSLVIGALATNENPAAPDRQLIYYADQPNACGSTQGQNRVFIDKLIYYIKNGSLWRRVVVPPYNLNSPSDALSLCSPPWQQNSCTPGYTLVPPCQTDDTEVMKNIDTMTVTYYDSPSGANVLTGSAILNASTIDVTITGKKTTVGKVAASSGTIRASKLNTVSADIPPPTSPVVSHTTTNSPDPTANFTWASSQYATSYNVSYKINSGSWVNTSVSAATASYAVSASRNDTVSFKIAAVNTSGVSPDSNDSTTFPAWYNFDLQNDWENYGGGYNTAQYTKTSTGIVFLKGLIRYGTATANTVIGTLPAGYRPSAALVYQVTTSANVTARIDVLVDGTVIIVTGSTNWISLDSIAFLPSTTTNTWTNLPMNGAGGWTNWGGIYAVVRTTTDSIGRIHIQGLAKAGTQTVNTTITTLPNANQRPPKTLHFPAGGSADSNWWVWYNGGEIVKRGAQTSSYLGLQAIYYPGATGTWNTLTPGSSWLNVGGNYPDLQYTKASDGVVTLRGFIKSGTTTLNTVIATLPVGYRPSGRGVFAVTTNEAFGRVDVDATGAIIVQSVSNVGLALNLSFISD
jgi:hypothetical protein